MTPVEERIEAKRIAEAVLADSEAIRHPLLPVLARAYLALLTEHSAREEALEQSGRYITARYETVLRFLDGELSNADLRAAFSKTALTTPESAPEQEKP